MTKKILTILGLVLSMAAYSQDMTQDDFLVAFEKGGLYGFQTTEGAVVLKPQYEQVFQDTLRRMALVVKAGKIVGINRKGAVLLHPFIYDNGPDYVVEGVFRMVENEKMGFATLDGSVIIPAIFDFVTPFEQGLAAYILGGAKVYDKNNEHWEWGGGHEKGYVNQLGQLFSEVETAADGTRRAVTKDGKKVILNKKGIIIG
jgi:hypothetical protein